MAESYYFSFIITFSFFMVVNKLTALSDEYKKFLDAVKKTARVCQDTKR